jgi:hypothetical protein
MAKRRLCTGRWIRRVLFVSCRFGPPPPPIFFRKVFKKKILKSGLRVSKSKSSLTRDLLFKIDRAASGVCRMQPFLLSTSILVNWKE